MDKYGREQVIAWAHRIAHGDTLSQIAKEIGVDTRSLRAQFKRHGLARPLDYKEGKVIPPPLDGTTPPATGGVSLSDVDEWTGMREFVGPHLTRALDALIEHGSIEAAADHLKIAPDALRARMSEARHISARRGWSPGCDMTQLAPPGMHVKGISGYYRVDPETGEKRLTGQWVKTNRDKEHRAQLLLDAMREVCEPYTGRANPTKAPKVDHKDKLALYPMGDPHIGLFASKLETGVEDTDLVQGARILTTAVEQLVGLAPPCERALIINLGDFFHTDNALNLTARSKNPLDAHHVWTRILRTGINAMIRVIELALLKHQRVDVICEIGNHDDHSSMMLAVALDLYFRREERVHIDMSPQLFHWFRFENNLIGTTHGNNVKMEKLPGIMAVDQREWWGQTEYHYWYTGHVHHIQAKEFPGCVVESFRTLAPPDQYHAGAGYRSGREMNLDILHAQHGREQRHTIGIERLRS